MQYVESNHLNLLSLVSSESSENGSCQLTFGISRRNGSDRCPTERRRSAAIDVVIWTAG